MKIEIWLQSSQPDWKVWKKLGSVSLKEAIYLSMDVCPSWYLNNILYTVNNYYDMSEYRKSISDEEFGDIKDVYESIEGEYSDRLKIAKSWAVQQDWVIGSEPNSPNDISESTYVDLRKFLKFAFVNMQYENETDSIPLELRGVESRNNTLAEPTYMASEDWKKKARELAAELLMKDSNLSLDETSDLIEKTFSDGKIFSSHGKRSITSSTIKRDALSKDAWFSSFVRKPAK
jgi:hypothetical protein